MLAAFCLRLHTGKAVGAIHELSYERVSETFTVNILSFFETSKVR
jgi:hypothetical protein